VNGEYFYDEAGFFFGSPHFAIYDRAALQDTATRWGVGFGENGGDLSDEATAALEAAGHRYWLWDTGKLLNTFLQIDGYRVMHHEPDNLMHIGGIAHYLSPPEAVKGSGVMALGRVDETRWQSSRFGVAGCCAAVLMAADEGQPSPVIPDEVDDVLRAKLEMVRREIPEMVLP